MYFQIDRTPVTSSEIEPYKKLLDLVASATNANNTS